MKTLDERLHNAESYARSAIGEGGRFNEESLLIGFLPENQTAAIIIDMIQGQENFIAIGAMISLKRMKAYQYVFIGEATMEADDATEDTLMIAACDATAAVVNVYRFPSLEIRDHWDSRDPNMGDLGGRWLTLLSPNFDPTGRTPINSEKAGRA